MKKLDYTYLLTKEIIERGHEVPRPRLKEKPKVLRGGCLLFELKPKSDNLNTKINQEL